jgi:hypothetical protein
MEKSSRTQGKPYPRKADTAGIKLCPAIAFDRIVGGRYKLRILWALAGRERCVMARSER